MLAQLPQVISGKTRATDILFPEGSMALVESIYKHNRLADYFNRVAAEQVGAYVEQQIQVSPDKRLRILEVGAGTGGTSQSMFARLKPLSDHIEEYAYTDLSQAFLTHAEREFKADAPYLVGRILNVEKGLRDQGIELGSYDIVIAANILHATHDIRHTLRHVKSALRRGGLLVLNEITGNSTAAHVTFGLTEGWWLYNDPALRLEGCPGLSESLSLIHI